MNENAVVAERWWTEKEAAEYIGVSVRRLLDWVRFGRLPKGFYGRAGKCYRFKQAQLDKFLMLSAR